MTSGEMGHIKAELLAIKDSITVIQQYNKPVSNAYYQWSQIQNAQSIYSLLIVLIEHLLEYFPVGSHASVLCKGCLSRTIYSFTQSLCCMF